MASSDSDPKNMHGVENNVKGMRPILRGLFRVNLSVRTQGKEEEKEESRGCSRPYWNPTGGRERGSNNGET